MEKLPPYDITDGAVEHAHEVMSDLARGSAHLLYRETSVRRAYSLDEQPSAAPTPKRIIINTLPQSREIMVSMEGGGCVILTGAEHVNQFTLITAGFQIGPARRIAELLNSVAEIASAIDEKTKAHYPQLQHHDRSQ